MQTNSCCYAANCVAVSTRRCCWVRRGVHNNVMMGGRCVAVSFCYAGLRRGSFIRACLLPPSCSARGGPARPGGQRQRLAGRPLVRVVRRCVVVPRRAALIWLFYLNLFSHLKGRQ